MGRAAALMDEGRAGIGGLDGRVAMASSKAGGGSMPEYIVTGKRSGTLCVCGF